MVKHQAPPWKFELMGSHFIFVHVFIMRAIMCAYMSIEDKGQPGHSHPFVVVVVVEAESLPISRTL